MPPFRICDDRKRRHKVDVGSYQGGYKGLALYYLHRVERTEGILYEVHQEYQGEKIPFHSFSLKRIKPFQPGPIDFVVSRRARGDFTLLLHGEPVFKMPT